MVKALITRLYMKWVIHVYPYHPYLREILEWVKTIINALIKVWYNKIIEICKLGQSSSLV